MTIWWGKWAGPPHLLADCPGYVRREVMWDRRHAIILTTSTWAPGAGKFIQMRRCCAYFSGADHCSSATCCWPALPSVILVMKEFFAHYFHPMWVATINAGRLLIPQCPVSIIKPSGCGGNYVQEYSILISRSWWPLYHLHPTSL